MEKDFNTSAKCDSSHSNDGESEQSIVGKFKSIINNTPLSKWFRKQDDNRSTIRRRDEEFEDEDLCQMQPPSKKVKLPGDERANHRDLSFEPPKNDCTSNKKFKYFPEPVAGPSGIKSRKKLNASSTAQSTAFSNSELLNGHKDSDSEESTSGYSSVARISSKEHVCRSQESSKQTSPTQNVATPNNARVVFPATNTGTSRSLFVDRTGQNTNTSMSSRRPSFNVSTFGSPNFMDKTLATKKIINSPFYNGRIVYGGASAYGRNLGRSTHDLRQNLKNSVRIKPVNQSNDNGDLVLGKTARRILETLEQYSSPVSDAKKIPVAAKKQPKEGVLKKYIGANPYLVRDSRVASNKELQVPSVLDLLHMKQKTHLQDVTETVKQIANSSKSDLNIKNYKLSTAENEKAKLTGKMKTKVSSVRQKQQVDEVPAAVNLKPVSLPITTLPKFDLNIPPPAAALPTAHMTDSVVSSSSLASTVSLEMQPILKPETKKTVKTDRQNPILAEYKFSDPLVIAENLRSIVAMNNFKFSEPLCKKSRSDSTDKPILNFKMPDSKSPALMPKKNNGESGVKVPAMLTTGSVMDVLGKKSNDSLSHMFKPEQGSWECGTCMIRNQPAKSKCVACETPRSAQTTTKVPLAASNNDFGSQFKMTVDKWECATCLVRNDNNEVKCVSCSSSKPPLKNAFVVPENTWECPTCMIRNKNEAIKCAACETANPKSANSKSASTPTIVNKLSQAVTGWECSCCLVRNKEDATKCIACEAARKTASKTSSNSFGASFKLANDQWECSVCMVRNKSSNKKCECCEAVKPGSVANADDTATSREPKSTLKFNFGIDKAAATAFNFGIPATAAATLPKPAVDPAVVFGEGLKPKTTATPSFSFGITKEQPQAAPPADPEKTPVQAPSIPKTNPLLKPNEKLPEKAVPASTGFKFDVPKSEMAPTKPLVETTTIPTVTTGSEPVKPPMFNFTAPATMFSSASPKVGSGTFGFGSKPTAAAVPLVSTVGQTAAKPATAAPVFGFGANNKAPEAPLPTVNNGFGKINSASFNVPPPAYSSEIKPFSFKNDVSSTSEPSNKTAMFSFDQSAGKVQSPSFNFNQPANAPIAFNFSGGKTDGSTTSGTATMFGAGSNSGKNGTFNFGTIASNNNSQKAMFSFGAPANIAAASPRTSGFNFGAAATASTSASHSGGFNFSIGAPPSFDVNAKPSFNFTDGSVTTFAAQPAAEGSVAMAPRKIKKAVRRTQR